MASSFAKEVAREKREHPSLVKRYGVKIAKQIALDHRRSRH